jgi:mono/diheme cytochrome c family protein
MRHRISSRRGGLQQQQFVIGFILVIVLIGVAVVVVQRRARTDLGGITGTDPTNTAQVALGRQIYGTRCASCHAADLAGQPNWQQPQPDGTLVAPPLDETGLAWKRTDQWLFTITKDGGQAAAPPGSISGMPGFGGGLSDEQIWAVLTYIKSTWPQDVQTAQPSR